MIAVFFMHKETVDGNNDKSRIEKEWVKKIIEKKYFYIGSSSDSEETTL